MGAVCKDLESKFKAEQKALTENGGQGNDARLSELGDLIQSEQEKKRKWTIENVRRRHNYFPFILNLIGVLGQKGLLKDLTERAKEKKKDKLERMEAEKKKKEESEKEKAADKKSTE